MREKKRLEHLLTTDADLARRGDDIAAYFDLAKEGENVDGELRREIMACAERLGFPLAEISVMDGSRRSQGEWWSRGRGP